MSTRSVDPMVSDLLARITTAADDVRDAAAALEGRREARRRLVHEAVEEGVSQRTIARALGGGTGLVTKILANPGPEEAEA